MRLSMREAIRAAIREEMRLDPTVVVFGEDVAEAGGVFKVTSGLFEEFGAMRVRDTPIAETAIVGAALGASATGLRPIVEMMFAEFFGVAMDQVVTELAKLRYLSNGRMRVPVVIRASAGAGLGFGAQHSQTLESWFMSTPGLIVVCPSGPRSAYALTRAAIRSDDPVIVIEPRVLYGFKEEFDPEDVADITLGRALTARGGQDVTVVALGQMVHVAMQAAEDLSPEISCEVIDLGTILPWDRDAVFESLGRTGRLVTVEESPMTGGWGTDIVSSVTTSAVSLRSTVVRVTCPDAPVPSGALEAQYLPSREDVVAAVRRCLVGAAAAVPRWSSWSSSAGTAVADGTTALTRRRTLSDNITRFERMLEIRAFEDGVADLFGQGLISGAAHTYQGQEAIAVGLASMTEATDWFTCTYRGHGIAIALGADPSALMAEILGRREGCVGGRGGSMHLTAPEVGLFPTFAIVGAGLPVAVGAALSAQVRGSDSIAVAVFGDGATNIGAFHEALNLAAVWKLPAVFICENNLYGEYSPARRTSLLPDLADRAAAYGMPGEVVDGMQLNEVVRAVRTSVARARAGEGPSLLEMKTYRFSGHSRGDAAKYRPDAEVQSWRRRDPILLFEQQLLNEGTSAAEIARAKAAANQTVATAIGFAVAGSKPEAGDIFSNIWSSQERPLVATK
jgi:pyruvate/2-oxoglutarate/acetoin dehydrogenase E1 component/TPP-dependent pyruvate/acetoin dehydrogenase alpha subunit